MNSFYEFIQMEKNENMEETGNKFSKIMYDTLNLVDEGIIILDKKQIIKFINYPAKSIFFSTNSNFMLKVRLEGKMFSDLITHDFEALNSISGTIKNAISANKLCHIDVSIKAKNYSLKISPANNINGEQHGVLLIFSSNNLFKPQNSDTNSQNRYYQMQHNNLLKVIAQLSDKKAVFEARINELETNQNYLMKQSSANAKQLRLFQLYLDNIPIPIAINNFPDYDIEYANIAFCGISKIDKKLVKGIKDREIFDDYNLNFLEKSIDENIEKKGFFNVETQSLQVKQLILRDASFEPIKLLRIFHKYPHDKVR